MGLIQDALSPYYTAVEQGSTPANPASGNQKLFIRTSDHVLCYVNSSGTVTPVGGGAPAAHGAKVHRASTNFSVGNNTYTPVAFDAHDYDTDSIHSDSVNNTRLTIPTITGVTTGLWAFGAYGYTDITTGRVDCEFRLNGSTIIGFNEYSANSTIGPFAAHSQYVFSAADYVECMVRTVGGAANAVFDAGASPYFFMAFLGKVS